MSCLVLWVLSLSLLFWVPFRTKFLQEPFSGCSWKGPWCWERLRVGGEGDDRGWDGWMASPTGWTWVWVNSGSCDGQGGLACCSPRGRKESDSTEWLSWAELPCMFCLPFQSNGSRFFWILLEIWEKVWLSPMLTPEAHVGSILPIPLQTYGPLKCWVIHGCYFRI